MVRGSLPPEDSGEGVRIAHTRDRVALTPLGIIEVAVVGRQSAETVAAMGRQIREFALQLRGADRPVLILDDITHMGRNQPSAVPRAVAHVARRIDFDRVAMLGTRNPLLRYGSNLIILATGKSRSIRYFVDRGSAELWLLAPRSHRRRSRG